MRAFLVLLFLVIVGIVGGNYYLSANPARVKYVTEKMSVRDVTESVAVTGSAEPIEVRVVQSQVPGVVEKVLVDFNDEVKDGDTLALLSSDIQRVQFQEAQAALERANAAVKAAESRKDSAESQVSSAELQLEIAKRNLATAIESFNNKLIAADKVDTARDLVRQAENGVAAAKSLARQATAGEIEARSQVTAANVAIELAKLNLDKTVLKSNMTGVVLNKDLRVGDTVGGPKLSLTESAPALFEIAAPLGKMRALVKINEADYSRVRVGQSATFTIDAYPDEKFTAKVVQIRNAPTSDRTAVSYTTVIEFDNRQDPKTGQWMIKPRSTVSADIEIRQEKNVLVVPNGAVLYTPSSFDEEIPSVKAGERLVWSIGPDGKPVPRIIQAGITDGAVTQVLGGDLKEGDEVITAEPVSASSGLPRLPFGN